MRWHGIALLLLLAPDAFCGEVITGTATFRERIAVPPAAVFEASREDVSRADAPADVLGQVRVDSPGNPPIRFEIAYDAARIEPSHTYSVQTRIIVDGQLMFVTDRIYPVLTRGAGSTSELLLKKTGGPLARVPEQEDGTGSMAALPAHGLRMPATFRGDLPCADCEAMRHHLDLWPDQVFHLHREWVGRNLVRDEVGRWRVDPSRQALILSGGGEMPLQFEIKGPDRLRLLDLQGKPITSKLPYELISDGTLTPADLNPMLAGELTYMADAARFTECLTGRNYPIAQEGGEFLKLQRAYQGARSKPGETLYVTFEGSIMARQKMEGTGTERAVVVRRFINVWPHETCERARADPSLTNTYWRIVKLGEESIQAVEGRREPHLVLRKGEGRPTAVATVGCNHMTASYTLGGESLIFTEQASTKMACPAPLDELEGHLRDMLAKARQWRIKGPTLELWDESGRTVGLLEAVYF